MKHVTSLWISLFTIFFFQFMNGVSTGRYRPKPIVGPPTFKTPEMENLALRVSTDGVRLLTRESDLTGLATGQTSRLQVMAESFNKLVNAVKIKFNSCVDSNILSVLNVTQNINANSGITECLDKYRPINEVLDTINKDGKDFLTKLKPIDDRLSVLRDEGKRRQSIAEANWSVSKVFRDSYYRSSKMIVYGYALLDACIDNIIQNLITQVVTSTLTLKDCVHSKK